MQVKKILDIEQWIIISIGIVLGFLAIYFISIFHNPLKNILSETEDMPNYVVYDTLYSEFGEIPVGSECYKQNEDYNLKEIFCVKNKRVYFVYTMANEEEYYWAIGSIGLETMEFQTHCKFYEPQEAYDERKKFADDYKEQNGYFYNNEIVLTDYEHVLTYNINVGNMQKYDYKEFSFPQKECLGEFVDAETIMLKTENISKLYTLKGIAEKSAGFAEIYDLKQRTIWSGESYIDRFLSEYSVQTVNNKLYVVGQCWNYHGCAYAVILEYDEINDLWNYTSSARSAAGDIVHRRCYVIP